MPDTPPPTPSRDATVTATCLTCHEPIAAGHGRIYCSPRCRQAAYRRRTTPTVSPAPPPAARNRRDTTIYACPDCDTRTLRQQRCPDCNTFTRRLGTGGHCPHCDEPITVEELLQVPLDIT
jgi:Zinc-ribbon containing domain